MLSYNDALFNTPPSSSSCVVCHELVSSECIVWHKMSPDLVRADTYFYMTEQHEILVPICTDCADLFHDVRS